MHHDHIHSTQDPFLARVLHATDVYVTDVPEITFWKTGDYLSPAGVNPFLRKMLSHYDINNPNVMISGLFGVVKGSATSLKPRSFDCPTANRK